MVSCVKRRRSPGTKRTIHCPSTASSMPNVWKNDMRNFVRNAGKGINAGSPKSKSQRWSSPRKRLCKPPSVMPHVQIRRTATSPKLTACSNKLRAISPNVSRAVGPTRPVSKTSSKRVPCFNNLPSNLAGKSSASMSKGVPSRKSAPMSRNLLNRPSSGWKFFFIAKPAKAFARLETFDTSKLVEPVVEASSLWMSSTTSVSSLAVRR
mmetsp:Transcript_88008/g.247332  ORF Transcript_88008/g.247332 Transcript_88008/m.247332 type:complete len:208 (-) Transcript_88008:1310-1933(-)